MNSVMQAYNLAREHGCEADTLSLPPGAYMASQPNMHKLAHEIDTLTITRGLPGARGKILIAELAHACHIPTDHFIALRAATPLPDGTYTQSQCHIVMAE